MASAEFEEAVGIGGEIEASGGVAASHTGVGGNDGVDIDDIAACGEGDVATAEGADALEEVTEVDPPSGGSGRIYDGGWATGIDTTDGEEARGRID